MLLLVTVGTASLTYLYDRDAALPQRLASGAAVGLTLLGLLGYSLALSFGLSGGTVVLAAFPLLLPLALFFQPEKRRLLRRDLRRLRPRRGSPTRTIYSLVAALTALLLLGFFGGTLSQENGAFWTNNHHNPGDLAWHLAVIQGFAVGENFPPEHPEFAGVPLTYPFLADFVAAELKVLGASLPQALFLQNITLALSLLSLLHAWALHTTRSRFAFLLVPLLVFLNGGWGWLNLIADASTSPHSFLFALLHPLRDATLNDSDLRWGNMLTTLIGTQRGFLMALPLAITVFELFWKQFGKPFGKPWRKDGIGHPDAGPLAAAGLITGLLPLVHAHSFLVLLLSGGTLAALQLIPLLKYPEKALPRFQEWLAFFGIAVVIALPQALSLMSGSTMRQGTFLGAGWGWESCADNLPAWAIFWYRNTGPVFPLLALALFWLPHAWRSPLTPRLKWYIAPFLLCFILGNSMRLAPWMWDNIKILFYFQPGAALLVASLLATFWRRGGFGRVLAPFLALLLVIAGGLDTFRVVSGQTHSPVYTAEGVAFARLVERLTPPEARILHGGAENHPVLLSGRRTLCGFMAILWSHGIDYEARYGEARRIYSGGLEADRLISRWKIDYVVLGPMEREDGTFSINDAYFNRFSVVGQVGSYRLLRPAATAGESIP